MATDSQNNNLQQTVEEQTTLHRSSPSKTSMIHDSTSLDAKDHIEYLYTGTAFNLSTSKLVTLNRPTCLIILAGPVESGKTTLIINVYNSFQKGPFADSIFAGSLTLSEFERCSHDSRIASYREYSTTERTKVQDDYRFFHLCLRDKKPRSKKRDFLFTDLSGEVFEAIKNSEEECKRHKLLLRADHFVLTLDGNKIADPLSRGQGVNDGLMLLRQCLDSKMLGPQTLVDIVFTKWDIIKAKSRTDDKLIKFINEVQDNKFRPFLSERIERYRFARVAAEPDPRLRSELKPGYGVPKLFRRWINEAPKSRIIKPKIDVKEKIERQIDRYHL